MRLDVEVLDEFLVNGGGYHRMYICARGKADSDSEALDAVGDAYIKLVQRLAVLPRDVGSLAGYLCVIAQHRVYYNRNRDKQRRAVEMKAAQSPGEAPVDQYERIVERAVQFGCLGKMTARRSQALVFRYLDDLSTNEVADIMGISAGAVRHLLKEAKASLRDCLELRSTGP